MPLERGMNYSRMFYLDLPEGLGAGGGGGGLPQRGSEEDVLLLLVVVTGQKLFLLSMKQPHHVSLTQAKRSDCQTELHSALQTWKLHAVPLHALMNKKPNLPPLERLPCSR